MQVPRQRDKQKKNQNKLELYVNVKELPLFL